MSWVCTPLTLRVHLLLAHASRPKACVALIQPLGPTCIPLVQRVVMLVMWVPKRMLVMSGALTFRSCSFVPTLCRPLVLCMFRAARCIHLLLVLMTCCVRVIDFLALAAVAAATDRIWTGPLFFSGAFFTRILSSPWCPQPKRPTPLQDKGEINGASSHTPVRKGK